MKGFPSWRVGFIDVMCMYDVRVCTYLCLSVCFCFRGRNWTVCTCLYVLYVCMYAGSRTSKMRLFEGVKDCQTLILLYIVFYFSLRIYLFEDIFGFGEMKNLDVSFMYFMLFICVSFVVLLVLLTFILCFTLLVF